MKIEFEGDCSVQRNGELLVRLRDAVAESKDELVLSFAGVQGADLSFFQLLASTRRSCQTMGKKLVLNRDLPEDLSLSARRTGFAEIAVAPEGAQAT